MFLVLSTFPFSVLCHPFEEISIGFINKILLGAHVSVPKVPTVLPDNIQSPFVC